MITLSIILHHLVISLSIILRHPKTITISKLSFHTTTTNLPSTLWMTSLPTLQMTSSPTLWTTSLPMLLLSLLRHLTHPTLTRPEGGSPLVRPTQRIRHMASVMTIFNQSLLTFTISAANAPGPTLERPLRPGEVTRGGITPPLPRSMWRVTGADPSAPSASSAAVIRVSVFSSSFMLC